MKIALVAATIFVSLRVLAQYNSMSAELLSEKSISWIRTSYFKKGETPEHQVFYGFDTLGRISRSNSSDDVMTYWKYPDSMTCIKTTVNPDIGNRIIEISRKWQTMFVIIYSADGDSIYHQLVYDTLKTSGEPVIRCYDVSYPAGDSTYRQLYTLDGKLLMYEIFDESGNVSAYYRYSYVGYHLDYSEYYENEKFIYKEKITYFPESDIRKQRVQVAGNDMFSNEETRNVTRYILNDEGLIFQEVEYLGKEHVSTIGYSYQKLGENSDEDQ